jgi:hypothetical protein
MRVTSSGNVFDGEWQLMPNSQPGTLKWIKAVSPTEFIVKTQTLMPSLVAEENAKDLAASEGKRWGDGQVIGRVPLDMYHKKLVEPTRQKDKKWLSRFWNDPDNRAWRTFKGNV